MSRVSISLVGALGVALMLGGCAARKESAATAPRATPEAPEAVACTPAQAGDPMVGTWYSVSRQRGFAGDFQTLTVLSADGTMRYETQLKVGRKTRPALRETGCWHVADGIYTMQTTQSNGEPVDASDPIYQNRYRVEKVDSGKLTLRELKRNGQAVTARRMQPGYRLPY
ncbi:lipoprotein [Bordetella bronchiseptica]|uniref:lipoprotein n=1 Tax=Bordetella bronchiseptica TaxID=518 RepID=UPI0002902566|nr:lipoprotein [Bordetella bronchiseptica]AUL17219.1 hypothetical protein BTL45_20905 [Bordetella bronchiseptica]AWP60452.1 hypothetical protein B7P02_21535 [Bordetella bronchiseptica]AZW32731.1 hypothetical protein CS343_21740 [Bordetella bronchiseptica]QET70378.1 hypothetical protein FOB42_08820 [Bordetella bronchiseptica]QIY00277.1 hypothetical protein FOC01_09370 [Bordetella bronchiseptica]